MGFVYIATGYFGNPKIARVSGPAKLLHLASILWTAEQLTDGYLPPDCVNRVANGVPIARRSRAKRVAELVQIGLWDELPDGGFRVHDFEVHNRSSTRAVVEANRLAWQVRQARHRAHLSRRDE